jgi:hypothetical protein
MTQSVRQRIGAARTSPLPASTRADEIFAHAAASSSVLALRLTGSKGVRATGLILAAAATAWIGLELATDAAFGMNGCSGPYRGQCWP